MHRSLLDIMVDPISKAPLELEDSICSEGQILSGRLCSPEGRSYLITNGIPHFVLTTDADQRQTGNSFGFK